MVKKGDRIGMVWHTMYACCIKPSSQYDALACVTLQLCVSGVFIITRANRVHQSNSTQPRKWRARKMNRQCSCKCYYISIESGTNVPEARRVQQFMRLADPQSHFRYIWMSWFDGALHAQIQHPKTQYRTALLNSYLCQSPIMLREATKSCSHLLGKEVLFILNFLPPSYFSLRNVVEEPLQHHSPSLSSFSLQLEW